MVGEGDFDGAVGAEFGVTVAGDLVHLTEPGHVKKTPRRYS